MACVKIDLPGDVQKCGAVLRFRVGKFGKVFRRLGVWLLISASIPAQALAGPVLPTGGKVVTGSAHITRGADSLTIRQSSDAAIINWNSFSIGTGGSVLFNNGSGTTLSRVTGNISSQIDGRLSATGSLYLVNPAGVVVGSDGRVATGGSFIASTHDLADGDFLDGGSAEFSGLSTASVINNGIISSANGDVALIARRVENAGTITAAGGTVALAAGYDVLMRDVSDADGKFAVRLGSSDSGVLNSGTVEAAQIEMRANGGNVYALAGNTTDVVKATGVSSSGGRIFLTAGADGTVKSTAHVVARKKATKAGSDGGSIEITGGTVELGGVVDASATGSGTQGGSITAIAQGNGSYAGDLLATGGIGGIGGQIETSGSTLAIAEDIFVSTLASGGAAGNWLIDPYNVTISNDADTGAGFTATGNDTVINVTTLTNALSSTGITVSTGSGGSQAGDITVAAPISWSANTTLTLNAAGSIDIGKDITATGTSAGLSLVYGGNYDLSNGARVTLSGASASLSLGGHSYTLIHNVDDLQAMSSSGYYALAEDIDASDTATWNSGAGFNPISNFGGTFAGLDHAIDGLTINRPGETTVAPFNGIALNAVFRDFTMSNVSIIGQGVVAGVIARVDNGSISNVHVTGSVASTAAGGQVGGLVGWDNSSPITGSSAAVTVSGIADEMGGLVGRLRVATISDSYATGSVTGTSNYAGGLVGSTYQGGTLTNVYASGYVSGTSNVGGLVGGASIAGTVTATNAYWDVDSTGQSTSYAGTGISNANAYTQATYSGFDFTNTWVMIAGETRPMLQSEYSTAIFTPAALQLMSLDLSADYTLGADLDLSAEFTANGGYYGGLWGSSGFVPVGTFSGSFDGQSHTITDLTINRSSSGSVGLFSNLTGSVSDVGLIGGSVTAGANSGTLVGAIGSLGSVTRSYSTASLSASGNFSGGLVGQNIGTISLSWAGGAVTSTAAAAGGFVGVNDGTISDSYATGKVSATTYAGGFAGGNHATLTHVYATGLVSGPGTNGGLTPYNTGTVTQSYWDTQTSGTTSGYGTGLTTAQLQGTLPTGFSSATWGTGANLYPYFGWQYATTPEAVSGIAYSDAGTTALIGAEVSAISGGALLGSASTGANGYYYILTSGTVDTSGALAYLDGESTQAAALGDSVTSTGVAGLNIYGASLTLVTGEATLSGTLANLTATLGSYSDTDLNFIDSGVTQLTTSGYGLYVNAASSYTLDTALASGGLLSLSSGGTFGVSGTVGLTAADALTVAGPISWSDSSALTLTTSSGGNVSLGGAVSGTSGSLTVAAAGTATSSSAVDVGTFVMTSGTWSQIAASLPSFSATDFRLNSGATFLRATGGNGSVATPYQIADVYGLQGMASTGLLAKSFALAQDIDASGTTTWNSGAGFTPIGNSSNNFSGSFDGQSHTISGLTIDRSTTDYVGLFGVASSTATISDVGLVGGSITGRDNVGALAGQSSGTITGAFATANVTGGTAVGGLVGNDLGTIDGSYATGTVNATTKAGGLVGTATGDTIRNSYAEGSVTSTSGSYLGGLVGSANGTISASYATGTVSGANYLGGLVGGSFSSGNISESFATGNVGSTSSQYVGGLTGLSNGTISNSYATGSVTGYFQVAGLVGQNNAGAISNSYAAGVVSGGGTGTHTGGLVGFNSGTVTNSFYDVTTTGQSDTGKGTGLTTAAMKSLATYTGAGWSADDTGGTSSIWRVYDGSSYPLLRTFLTTLTVTGGAGTKTYDGSATSTSVGTLTYSPSGYDSSLVLGTATYIASGTDAGSYSGSTLTLSGLYSSQFGYDLTLNAGTLDVAKASLTVTALNDGKTYDGLAYTGGNGVSYAGFVGGDTAADLSGTLSYGGSAQGAVDAGSYTLTASGRSSGTY
ncbi:MAG: GLUG motif-containing protein, partial [Pseudodonghicola sp.]